MAQESKLELEESKLDKVKGVVKRNWKPFAIGVGFTVVTVVVTRRVTLRYFPTNTMRINKMIIKDSVFYIQTYARNQGSPSYIVRNLTNGDIYTSQLEAAERLGVSRSTVSRYFNGKRDHVAGNQLARVAIAVPKNI